MKEEENYWDEMKTNPKSFYSHIKKLQKSSLSVGPFLDKDGNQLPESSSETLNKVFCSVFTSPDQSQNISDHEAFFSHDTSHSSEGRYVVLADISITPEEVNAAINAQSLDSATGPDGIPAIFD